MDNSKGVEINLFDIKIRVLGDRIVPVNDLVSEIKPMFPKSMLYELGSTDPVASSYSSFSGIDCKIHIVDPGKPYKKEFKIDEHPFVEYFGLNSSVQGISFGKRSEDSAIGGTIIFLILDGMETIEELLGKKKRIVLNANNEFGKSAILADKEIIFDNYCSWGISIDDIVTEVSINFIELKDNRR